MKYIKDVFKYGLQDLDFELTAITKKIIDENMFLRERQIEKEKLLLQKCS